MPNTRTAKRAFRKSERRKIHNLREKRSLIGAIKDFKKDIAEGKISEASTKLPSVYKKLDKAAKHNIIKKNKASRLKSRLTKRLGRTNSAPNPEPETPTEPVINPED